MQTTNIFIRIIHDPAKIRNRQQTDTSLRVLPPHKAVQYGWEYKIIMDLWETGCEDWKWRELPQWCIQMDSCCEHGNKPTDSVTQGCQVTLLIKVCTVAPSICQSSGYNCLMLLFWCLEFGGIKSVYCHNSLKFYNQLSNYQLSKNNTVPCYHICY